MPRARIEVFTLPPIAIPRRTDILLTGATRYISKFPDSLSQNHWDDMFQRTFVQKAIIAPPMITAAPAVGGSMIARSRITYAPIGRIGSPVAANSPVTSRLRPLHRAH